MILSAQKSGLSCGFTRAEAITVVGTTILLALLGWLVISLAGEKRRIWVCAHHLKTLGQAFNDYAHAHGDALPPAVLDDGTKSTSWDKEIAIYLEQKSAGQKSPDQQKLLESKIAYLFKCPSDREPRGGAKPRSYSMPIYDINRLGWPPQSDSIGGLGLYLDSKSNKQIQMADSLFAIKTSLVKVPADTALLVEHINILNTLWSSKMACVSSPSEQFEAKTFEAKDFHHNCMNYLMLDGHVELLSMKMPSLAGVLTIRQGD